MIEQIPSPMSNRLLPGCEDIVEGVKEGHVVGVALVVLLRRGRYFVDVLGEAARNPTLTRGAALALDDCLSDISRRQRDTGTTR